MDVRRIRPLFQSPRPRRNQYAPSLAQSPLSSVSGSSLRPLPKTALASLRRLSKPKPLRMASVLSTWVMRKVRSAPFPATACGPCRKLRSLPCAASQNRSRFAWLRFCRRGSCDGPAVPPQRAFPPRRLWGYRCDVALWYLFRTSPARGSPRRRCRR